MTTIQPENTSFGEPREDQFPRTNASARCSDPDAKPAGFYAHVSRVQTAQILMLQQENVIDEAAGGVILRAIDAARLGQQALTESVWGVVSAAEDRIDASLPADISGAASLGRTRSETIATALRMDWREQLASLALLSLDVRTVLHELAHVHSVTVMGAFADRRAVAPTTLAHFLGGVIGPLESTWPRLLSAIDALDRSPLGSGLLVAEIFSADRNATADLLGFREPIANTLDASGAIEDIVEALEAISAQAAVVQRFIHELLIWIRTDPTSFFIDERWETVPEPGHPAHAVSNRLEQINYRAKHVGVYAHGAVELLRSQAYGPVSVVWNQIAENVNGVFGHAESLLVSARDAVREALIVNRAYLANRAGRLYSTAADLAGFLMEDQQLGPADAQKIAGLAIARLKEESLEAAQINPDVIDSAAVLVIGQELKVEMETLGRYIAPRRYIERRDVLGSPKADRTRSWLEHVAAGIKRDQSEVTIRRERWHAAERDIENVLAASAESVEN